MRQVQARAVLRGKHEVDLVGSDSGHGIPPVRVTVEVHASPEVTGEELNALLASIRRSIIEMGAHNPKGDI